VLRIHALASLVFGAEAVDAALAEARATLLGWGTAEATMAHQVGCALCDLLLACDTTDLTRITPRSSCERWLVSIHVGSVARAWSRSRGSWPTRASSRSRSRATTTSAATGRRRLRRCQRSGLRGRKRWRRLTTHELGTVRGMFSIILVAGRWAADTHPEAVSPDRWTRDIAAAYVADTLSAVRGQWAPNNRNRAS